MNTIAGFPQFPKTKEEFVERYLNASFKTQTGKDAFMTEYVALPCACGQAGCCGWAMVSNHPLSLKAHADLYAPQR